MKHEDRKSSLLALTAQLLLCNLNILLQLANSILERCTGVVDLIDDQDVLANQVRHLERAEIEPLGTCDVGGGGLDIGVGAQVLVEGETDGLDRNVGVARLAKEGSEDTGWDVTATADGDHKVRLEVVEDLLSRCTAKLVDLIFERAKCKLSADANWAMHSSIGFIWDILIAVVSQACSSIIATARSSKTSILKGDDNIPHYR